MGEVWRARDSALGRDVAIKVLPSVYATDPERLRRFEQEAYAAGQLNHPNILTIHAVGREGQAPYLVTELLEGATLQDLLGQGSLPPRKAIEYAIQIARGLAAAHDRDIVHRDLKPANLFVTADGRVKILDFGLAKLMSPIEDHGTPTRSASGLILGTVGYMSPEQVRGQSVDRRADLFAFGTILYEMLSGRRAFAGESAAETMHAILKSDPAPLDDVSAAVERIVRHCLEKNPNERFQSAHDLAFHLDAAREISSGGTFAVRVRRARGWPGQAALRWVPWTLAVGATATALWLMSGMAQQRAVEPGRAAPGPPGVLAAQRAHARGGEERWTSDDFARWATAGVRSYRV